jgi:hypothetical protein
MSLANLPNDIDELSKFNVPAAQIPEVKKTQEYKDVLEQGLLAVFPLMKALEKKPLGAPVIMALLADITGEDPAAQVPDFAVNHNIHAWLLWYSHWRHF